MSNRQPTLAWRAGAEALGTAFLLAIVVGSGIMGERLAGGNVAVALLANAIATGCGLIALILAFGEFSGAHFNPAVTLVEVITGARPWAELPYYVAAQIGGAIVGVWFAHLMFDLEVAQVSHHARAGGAQLVSEAVATGGLLLTILTVARRRPDAVPFAVGAYITSAYWFTASTSFANPAVTIARAMTDTFAGIRPVDAPGFIAAQLATACAVGLIARRWRGPVAP